MSKVEAHQHKVPRVKFDGFELNSLQTFDVFHDKRGVQMVIKTTRMTQELEKFIIESLPQTQREHEITVSNIAKDIDTDEIIRFETKYLCKIVSYSFGFTEAQYPDLPTIVFEGKRVF